jgi:hypothetical protein
MGERLAPGRHKLRYVACHAEGFFSGCKLVLLKTSQRGVSEGEAMQANDTPSCVLVYGREPLLLEVRAKVIHTAGFRTCAALSPEELSGQLDLGLCKALVLCHTLSEMDALAAATEAKQKIPDIKVIAMGSYSPVYDNSLGSFVKPEELLECLTRAVHPRR